LRLAIGLGNPGSKYIRTRHNMGFCVIDILARRLAVSFRSHDGICLLGTGCVDHVQIGLVKPLTYMNESGRAASSIREHLNLRLDELLVICDDTNLPLGKIRLRHCGSDGGHRGLSSVISHLAAIDFPRLRLGIGPPPEGQDLVDFVLEEFQSQEKPLVADMLEMAGDAVICFFRDGIESAMNRYNA
jgi:PTH1 family peptidyl-tRNA hydrolase